MIAHCGPGTFLIGLEVLYLQGAWLEKDGFGLAVEGFLENIIIALIQRVLELFFLIQFLRCGEVLKRLWVMTILLDDHIGQWSFPPAFQNLHHSQVLATGYLQIPLIPRIGLNNHSFHVFSLRQAIYIEVAAYHSETAGIWRFLVNEHWQFF